MTLSIAHRGASAQAPENTLVAVRRCGPLGADLVEVDLQRTRDGALVLLHDASLARTTDARRRYPRRAPWAVADFTLAEIVDLDAGAWKGPQFVGERVPTLAETLAALPGRARLLLELKLPQDHPGIVADLGDALAALPSHDAARVVVQSFDVLAMKELSTRVPGQEVGILGSPRRENLAALGSWAGMVNPNHALLDAAYVDSVHRAGMRCFTWTLDRPFAMRRALRVGVDGVITNKPDLFARVRDAHPVPVQQRAS